MIDVMASWCEQYMMVSRTLGAVLSDLTHIAILHCVNVSKNLENILVSHYTVGPLLVHPLWLLSLNVQWNPQAVLRYN